MTSLVKITPKEILKANTEDYDDTKMKYATRKEKGISYICTRPKTVFEWNVRNKCNMILFAVQWISLFVFVNCDEINAVESDNPIAASLHPVILIASIVASASLIILCLALFVAWKKGQERFRSQMEDMHMTKETKREFDSNLRAGRLQMSSEASLNPLPTPSELVPTPSELDNQSMISLSMVDSKSYRPADAASVASMESYSYSLEGYSSSIANSSTAYGY